MQNFSQCCKCFLATSANAPGLLPIPTEVAMVESDAWALLCKMLIPVNSPPFSPCCGVSSVPLPSKTTRFTSFHILARSLGRAWDKTCGSSPALAMNSMYKVRYYISSGCRKRVRYAKALFLPTSSMRESLSSAIPALAQRASSAGSENL
jgi:hypothetical protein